MGSAERSFLLDVAHLALSANGGYLKHVELIDTSTFTRQITALLSDEDYGRFSPGWQRIQILALSSRVAAASARFA
jgi:hypothetical protein